MGQRKRGRDEMEADDTVAITRSDEPTLLHKLRNLWQFANLAQYLALFRKALKIDGDLDIEELEAECLKPQPSQKLAQIGLALLKHISSHKGLTQDIFDEYARRQYVAKAPSLNPFGTEDLPGKFDDFDVLTKIRVLQQLSIWTLNNPNTIRERLNATEGEQTDWRMSPYGWDAQERVLYVLDDLRMYRQTDPPPPTPPSKSKSKAKSRKSGGGRSKRRKLSSPPAEDDNENEDVTDLAQKQESVDDGFGGRKWECLCITMEDYQEYMAGIRRSKHPDEKNLYKRLETEIMPDLLKSAEEQARREARKMKEWETLQKLATAKRSSRLSAKAEKQKEIEEAEEVERQHRAELAMAKAEQEKQKRMEEANESQRQTREQRLREREAAKILHEENVRRLEEEEARLVTAEARQSERHLQAQKKKAQQELEKLKDKDHWYFDCEKCGKSGENVKADHLPQICCDGCDVWQHSSCHGIPNEVANQQNFTFFCTSCRQKRQAADEPKLPPLKLKLNSAAPSSPNLPASNGAVLNTPGRKLDAVVVPMAHSPALPSPSHPAAIPSLSNGPSLSPRGQALGPPGIQRSEAAYGSPFSRHNGSPPSRPYSNGATSASHQNGLSAGSPPRVQLPTGMHDPFVKTSHIPQQNGSPFDFSRSTQNSYPTNGTPGRPVSAAGPNHSSHSPIKHSPAPSPRPTNGTPVPNAYNFNNSPRSSFPPPVNAASAIASNPGATISPSKRESPAPPSVQRHPQKQLSPPTALPAIASPTFVSTAQFAQMPAQILPDPVPAPLKHSSVQPGQDVPME